MTGLNVAVASDHAGFVLKNLLADRLRELGHDVTDLGTDSTDSVDYPDFGKVIGEHVAAGSSRFGVAVCGSGIGICIAANKVAGIRAATVHDVTSARLTRNHNDANIMCVGERFIGPQVALDAMEAFLVAEFEGGRHQRRVDKLG